MGTALLVALGAAGSLVGAQTVARNDAQRSHQTFVSSSAEIASSLKLAIQQEANLVISTEAFVAANPDVSNAAFLNWVRSMHVKTRYPEVASLGYIAYVRPAQLPQFIARILADPPTPLPPGQTYRVTPPGNRPIYCLTQAGYSNGGPIVPLDYDSCTAYGSHETVTFGRNISVASYYFPFTLGKVDYLAVGAPIYSGGVNSGNGASPQRHCPRRGRLDHTACLRPRPSPLGPLGDRCGLPLRIRLDQGHLPGWLGSSGSALVDDQSPQRMACRDLRGGGRIRGARQRKRARPPAGGIRAQPLARSLDLRPGNRPVSGSRTGRRAHPRAPHLALHDALTELPNRALILDRIEQMLARSRREHTPVAVLFLDLDNFKDVNDTLGHAAGDQLLAAVAARLTSAIRQEDTVGRLGGDEFVVLAEGASLAAGAEMVAERILDVLATPFEIAGSDTPLTVTASIGIAEGMRATPDELLRDADIALYQAKAAGKRCAVVFAPAMQEAVDDDRNLEADCTSLSKPISSSCSTSPPSTCPPGPSPVSRRFFAGVTRPGG